jgi:hypothetical protein
MTVAARQTLYEQRPLGSGRRQWAAYAKNEKANLSQAERNALKRLAPMLVAGYPRGAN